MKRVLSRRAMALALASVVVALIAAACGSSSSGGSGGGSSGGSSGGGSGGGSVKGANVTVVQAGGSDFSSADVPYFVSLLKKEGINAHLTAIADASSATRAVIAGQAQLGVNDLEDTILPVIKGHAPIKVIAVNNQANDYVLVAQKNITLQNTAGKTLGIDTPGSAGEGAAELGLKASGVDPTKIRYVTVGDTSARETAVVAGKIDIAPVHYPVALAALATGKVHEILNVGKAIGPYVQSALIANDSFLKNTALSKAVVAAFIQAERWANSDRAGYIAYAKSQNLLGGLPVSQAVSTWNDYHAVKYFGVNGGICPTYINKTISLNQEVNLLPKNLPPTSTWLDPTLVQNYLTSHGQSANTC